MREKSTSAAQPRSTGGAPARLGAGRESETAPGVDSQGHLEAQVHGVTLRRLGQKQTRPFVALQSLGFHPVEEIGEEIAAVLSFAEATVRCRGSQPL